MSLKSIFRKLSGKPPTMTISGPTDVTRGKVGQLLGGGTHQYLYCPFAGYTDTVVDKQIWKYAHKTGAAVLTPTRDFETLGVLGSGVGGPGALKVVKPTDTLVVAGHGSYTANEISAKFGTSGTWKDLTANDLAMLLYLEGLSTDHIKVRMLSCWGGGLNPSDTYSNAGQAAAETFAAVLAKALGALNYHNIRVAGYRGATGWKLNQIVGVVVFPSEAPGVDPVPADGLEENITWFNSLGQKTNKPF